MTSGITFYDFSFVSFQYSRYETEVEITESYFGPENLAEQVSLSWMAPIFDSNSIAALKYWGLSPSEQC